MCGAPRKSTGTAAAEAATGGASPAALLPEALSVGCQQEAPSPVPAAAAPAAAPTDDTEGGPALLVATAANPQLDGVELPIATSAPTAAATTAAGPAEAVRVSESVAGAALGGPADAVLSRCAETEPAEVPSAAPEAPAAAVAAGSAGPAGVPAPCGSAVTPAQVPASAAALAACVPEKSASLGRRAQPAAPGGSLAGGIGQLPTGHRQPQQQAAQAPVSAQSPTSHLTATAPVAALGAPQAISALAVQPADGLGSAGEQEKAAGDCDRAALQQISAPPADFLAVLERAGLTRQKAVQQPGKGHAAVGIAAADAAPAPAPIPMEAGGGSLGDDDLAVVLHADPVQQAAAAAVERREASVCRQQHQLLQQYLSQDAPSLHRPEPTAPRTPQAPRALQPLQGQTQLSADCGAAMAPAKRARRKRRRSDQQPLQQQLQAAPGALLQDGSNMCPPLLPLPLPSSHPPEQQQAAAPVQGTITHAGMGLPAAAQVSILNAMSCLI